MFVDADFDEPLQLIDFAVETCEMFKRAYQRRKADLPSYYDEGQVVEKLFDLCLADAIFESFR